MLYKQTASYALSFGLPAIISFISIAIFTRLLTPEQFGYYSLLLIIIAFINNVLFQWIRLSLLRFHSTYVDKNLKEVFYSNILVAFITVMLFSLIISVAINNLISGLSLSFLVLFLLLIVSWLKAYHQLNLSLYRANFSSLKYGINNFIQVFLAFLVGVYFLKFFNFGGIGLILALGISLIIANIFPTLKYWKGNVYLSKINKDTLKEFMHFGLPLTITFAMGFIINSSDRLFISWLIDNNATGIYSAAYDFTDKSIVTIMSVVNLAAYSILIKVFEKKGKEGAAIQLKQNSTLLMIVSFPVVIVLIILSKEISYVFFGDKFAEEVSIIIPLITIAAFLKGVKLYYIDLAFQLVNKTLIQIIPVVVGSVINIILNLLLIPYFGINGAAIATVISYLISIILGLIIGKQFIDYRFPMFDFFKIVVASSLMILILTLLPNKDTLVSLTFSITLGIIIYTISLILLFYKSSFLNLRKILKKRI